MKTRPGTNVLIGIGIVVVLALIVALALSGRGVRTYEAGTPEAVAQSFIQALFDEDDDAALDHLSTELQEKCRVDRIDPWWSRNADSAVFEDVDIDGDRADIQVRLVSPDYDPVFLDLDFYDYDTETELELQRIDGEWKIVDATWPLAGCIWREG